MSANDQNDRLEENSASVVAAFNGLAFHCGETRNLIEDLDE
jgi:hypothetical protein